VGFSIFRSMNKSLAILLLILIPLGCKEKTVNLGKDISFDKEINISYGAYSEQKLDLYIPKNKGSIKGVFVIIHGGGWKAGNKSNLTFFTLSLMQKLPDYAFANINYRLADTKSFALPNQTDDIDSVLGLLVKRFSTNAKFILLGNSAGAHLSMLYAYKFNQDKKIKAVINIVGPSDLSDPNFRNYSDYSFVEKHLVDAKAIPTGISINQFANPINWSSTISPPTVSFYGNSDKVIPLSQKTILDSALNKNKVFNQSFEFSGGHLDWDKEKNAPFLINKIDEFLKHIQ